jgi:hypothetical protein
MPSRSRVICEVIFGTGHQSDAAFCRHCGAAMSD